MKSKELKLIKTYFNEKVKIYSQLNLRNIQKLFEQIKLTNHNVTLKREPNSQQNQNSSIQSQTDYFLDTFDSGSDGWIIDDCWNRTDINFYSAI